MSFKPLEFEPSIQAHWKEMQVQDARKRANAKGKKFYFLQGPPYTSGKIHLGQAWNNSLKDMVLRYKRMKGFNVWDRAGYDMHGLPTENKVMQKLQLTTNADIERFGLDKFSQECTNFCTSMMHGMNTDLARLGVTLDYSDPYQPITQTYMDGIWGFIKAVHKAGRLYKGKRTMMWCVPYATALAKHETYYKTVTDTSIFVKFERKSPPTEFKEYFVIWTTTPWTIPFNLGIMVNPDIAYARVKVQATNEDGSNHPTKKEIWIVAQSMVGLFVQGVAGKDPQVLEVISGEKLAGLKYIHPFASRIPALDEVAKIDAAHTILLSKEYVDTSAGSGLVHCAPGCGPEDFEVGRKAGLPAFNEVNEHGLFSDTMGFCAQKRAKLDDEWFIQELEKIGHIVAKAPIEHEYPFDERSHQPVIFRTTEQWFFKVEDLKEDMLKANEACAWVPQKAQNAFRGWLSNLRDNSITKQRFWGTPAPIWVCDKTGEVLIVGSRAELESLVKKPLPSDLHKPYIDTITFPSASGTYRRIPDVLDVWIDAGSASWNCLFFEGQTKEQQEEALKKWFPADFICEGKDQIRGWFNLLMVCSMLYLQKPAFTNVFMHGFIAGVDGQKMSKSLGNIISPNEIIEKYGADTLRMYMTRVRAGEDVAFNWDEIAQQFKTLNILYNVVQYTKELLSGLDASSLHELTLEKIHKDLPSGLYERYCFSLTERTVQEITQLYDAYELNQIGPKVDTLLFALSRVYIQAIREKAQYASPQEKLDVIRTLYYCTHRLLAISHPLIPFTTDYLYLQLRDVLNKDATHPDGIFNSLMQAPFPEVNTQSIQPALEKEVELCNDILSAILSARELKNIGVRYPLASVTICTKDTYVAQTIEGLKGFICDQANIKEIQLRAEYTDVSYSIKPVYGRLKELGSKTASVGQYLAAAPVDVVQTIATHALEQKNVTVQVSIQNTDEAIVIKPDYVQVQAVVKSHIGYASTGSVHVYLDTTMTPQLELEGLARDVMRRIQSQRKDMGLVRSDLAILTVRASAKLEKALRAHNSAIIERCGLASLTFGNPLQPIVETIKQETLEFSLTKQ